MNTVIIKSASKKIDGFVLQIDNINKCFSIGYQGGKQYKKMKFTKKQFDNIISECYKRGYTYKDKIWI